MPNMNDGAYTRPVTLGWALRRAALGVVILAVAMGAVAWLTYASIDPDPAKAGEEEAASLARD